MSPMCSISGCASKALARSWCSKHYTRWRKHGDPEWEPPAKVAVCSVGGCEDKPKARGYCSHHVERFYRYGDATAVPPRVLRAEAALSSGAAECITCNRRLPLDGFSRDKNRLTGRRWTCKECGYRANMEWVSRNREQVNAAVRLYRSSLPEEAKARARETVSEWKRRNRDSVRRSNDRRRALKAGVPVGEVDEAAIWERSGGCCAICGYELSRDTEWPDERFASLDHIVPLARGGQHATDNLQYTCLVCNLRKGVRPMASTVPPVKR